MTIFLFAVSCVSGLIFQVGANGCSSNFTKVKTYKSFVDRTLFIKEFIENEPQVRLITAPTRSGKSTIIDMLRKFFQMPIDDEGNRIDPRETENYKLFCEPPLEICRDKTFVENHLGQYPVIYFDYYLLKYTSTLEAMRSCLKRMVHDIFKQHKYLKFNSSLFQSSTSYNVFIKYCTNSYSGARTLYDGQIQAGFRWLSFLLYKHYNKKVIILQDHYDHFYHGTVFADANQVLNVSEYLAEIVEHSYMYNKYMERGLITGVLRVVDLIIRYEHFRDHRYLGNHSSTGYYGFTDQDVDGLLVKHLNDSRKIEETRKTVRDFYSGYLIYYRKTRLYNTWSVGNFFQRNLKRDNYWARMQAIHQFTRLIYERNSIKYVKRLLAGYSVYVEVNKSISSFDIIKLNEMDKAFRIDSAQDAELFYTFLYMLGYLSPTSHTWNYVNIPNLELQLYYGRILSDHYRAKYNHVDTIEYKLALNGFRSGCDLGLAVATFYYALQNLFRHPENYPTTETDFQYLLLAYAAEYYRVGTKLLLTPDDEAIKKRNDVVLTNGRGTVIVIYAMFLSKLCGDFMIHQMALDGHNKIRREYSNHLRKDVLFGNYTVYIGLMLAKEKRNITIVGSQVSSDLVTTAVTIETGACRITYR